MNYKLILLIKSPRQNCSFFSLESFFQYFLDSQVEKILIFRVWKFPSKLAILKICSIAESEHLSLTAGFFSCVKIFFFILGDIPFWIGQHLACAKFVNPIALGIYLCLSLALKPRSDFAPKNKTTNCFSLSDTCSWLKKATFHKGTSLQIPDLDSSSRFLEFICSGKKCINLWKFEMPVTKLIVNELVIRVLHRRQAIFSVQNFTKLSDLLNCFESKNEIFLVNFIM